MKKQLAIMFSALALAASADIWTDPDTGITWKYTDGRGDLRLNVGSGNVLLSGCSNAVGEVTIPSALGGRQVVGIAPRAFCGCRGLKSVVIPLGLKSIGDAAFCECDVLASVSIPSSVTRIERSAFVDCDALTSIVVDPGNPSYVVTNGFLCSKNGRILISGSGVDVTIPSNVTEIAEEAFSGKAGLRSVKIPSSVTKIGRCAFAHCSGLISFSVDPGNPSFSSPSGLLCTKDGTTLIAGVNGDVTIPTCVKKIEEYAFCDNQGLRSVVIPEGVTTIGKYAFSGCRSLTSVMIPSSVTSIGEGYPYDEGAFKDTPFYNNLPDGLVILGGGVLCGYKGVCPDTLTIPSTVKTIRQGAFFRSNGPVSLIISSGVVSIGHRAFLFCRKLESVTIPASVTNIDHLAFEGCNRLKSFSVDPENPTFSSRNGLLCSKDGTVLLFGVNGDVNIPEGVKMIKYDAFKDLEQLKSVAIPASFENLDQWNKLFSTPFAECIGLRSFSVNERNPIFSTKSGLLCSKDGTAVIAGVHGDVTIPEGVTTIRNGAFADYEGLTSLTIPSTITNVEGCAFSMKPIPSRPKNLKSVNVVKDGKTVTLSFDDFCKQWNVDPRRARENMFRRQSTGRDKLGTRRKPLKKKSK